MKSRISLALLLVVAASSPATAQFSSDVPGVPRAAVSIRGSKQNRTEWTVAGFRVPASAGTGDTVAGGIRLGLGASYRLFGQFEFGYDFTLFDGYMAQPPQGNTAVGTTGASVNQSQGYMRGLTGYGIRLGAKYQAISAFDPDGNGYAVGFGVALQPELQPLYGVEKLGDSVRQGGQFVNKNAVPNTFFHTNPFAKLRSTTELAAMASYRSRRLIGDAALVLENAAARGSAQDPSPLDEFDGVSLRAGGAYRLTPGFAVGGAYWGFGSPPWRDEVLVGLPGNHKTDQYAFMLQFGDTPEAGVDVMYTTPTGKYGESGRLYIRVRSTR